LSEEDENVGKSFGESLSDLIKEEGVFGGLRHWHENGEDIRNLLNHMSNVKEEMKE